MQVVYEFVVLCVVSVPLFPQARFSLQLNITIVVHMTLDVI